MNSPFNLQQQNNKIEYKIVVALERISESFKVLLRDESKKYSLSPIQIQILIFLNYHLENKCKISHLAQEFNMTKATISESVKLLFLRGLVHKSVELNDLRSYNLKLTIEGESICKKLENFTYPIENSIGKFSKNIKEEVLLALL
ncbi:MarR family winged helix-turn-helix transcriptional regulator [Flavobacterium geliluteum]|uniref:MarR family winged helix-turn-helix transcriptional regulator n=1 Tax=Flavobacterium geliluteum TaxID=2816120 RepID=UPI001F21D34F|nr:helix-turn-helix domain-containing protein [Flavobacterium geliluteum]